MIEEKCEILDKYKKQEWLDEILSVDENGEIEYEKDASGNLVQLTDHFGRPLFNKYTGEPIPKPVFIQQGTRITSERMNYIEEHICSLYGWKDKHSDAIEYIMIILDIEGTVQGGQGNFFDSFDNLMPKDMTWDKRKMLAARKIESGDVIVQVDDTQDFKLGDVVFIYDDVNYEQVDVKEIVSKTEIKLGQTKEYKNGAFIVRSTMLPNRVDSKFDLDTWDTYNTSYVLV